MLEEPGIRHYAEQRDNVTGEAANQQERLKGNQMVCTQCGTTVAKRDASKMRRNRRHFCGVPCYRSWWTRNLAKRGPGHPTWRGGQWIQKACLHCDTIYQVSRSIAPRSHFCSHACRAKFYFSGAGNVNWKGGVTPKHWAIRQTREYAEWRRNVYRRDRWTCQSCGYHGRQIVAHHIESFSKHPDKRFLVENGLTLCRPCHAALENPQRLIRPTRESVKIESDLHGDVQMPAEMTGAAL